MFGGEDGNISILAQLAARQSHNLKAGSSNLPYRNFFSVLINYSKNEIGLIRGLNSIYRDNFRSRF